MFDTEKSEIGKQCSQGNINRHTLGQKSYSRKRKDWVKEERLPPPAESSTAESSVVSSSVQNRALEWCLAHQRPTKDGKWEVDPTKVETVRVVQQVVSGFNGKDDLTNYRTIFQDDLYIFVC